MGVGVSVQKSAPILTAFVNARFVNTLCTNTSPCIQWGFICKYGIGKKNVSPLECTSKDVLSDIHECWLESTERPSRASGYTKTTGNTTMEVIMQILSVIGWQHSAPVSLLCFYFITQAPGVYMWLFQHNLISVTVRRKEMQRKSDIVCPW